MTTGKDQMHIQQIKLPDLQSYYTAPVYHIYLIRGSGIITVDFVEFEFNGIIALFTTPYQHLKIAGKATADVERLDCYFHRNGMHECLKAFPYEAESWVLNIMVFLT